MYGWNLEAYTGRSISSAGALGGFGKRVTVIGDLGDDTDANGEETAPGAFDPYADPAAGGGGAVVLPNSTPKPTVAPAPPTDNRPGPSRWVWDDAAGEYRYVWVNATTWYDLAARYLGKGSRHPEIWAYQPADIRARAKAPAGIWSGAHVRIPAEGIARARALHELPDADSDPHRKRWDAAPVTLAAGVATTVVGALVHYLR